MKKTCFILLLFCAATATAQNMQPQPSTYTRPKPAFRLNLYAGYVFDDKVDSYYSSTAYYNGTVKGGLQWGAGIEYMLRRDQGIELSYTRKATKAPTTYFDNGVKTREFDVAANYIMIGSTRYFRVKPAVEPYFGLQLGLAVINVSNATNNKSNSSGKFAWGVKGGTNLWVSPKVGIKLQLNLNSVTQAVGGGLYFGTGGVSSGLTSYSSILQFGLGGGLVFNFGG